MKHPKSQLCNLFTLRIMQSLTVTYNAPILIPDVQKKIWNRTLEFLKHSYLVVHSLLGLLQSLITSVTLSLPDISAVSFNAQARRLATPLYDIYACATT